MLGLDADAAEFGVMYKISHPGEINRGFSLQSPQ